MSEWRAKALAAVKTDGTHRYERMSGLLLMLRETVVEGDIRFTLSSAAGMLWEAAQNDPDR